MDLSRIGSNRKEIRATAFFDRKPAFSFNSEGGSLTLLVQRGDGMGTNGQYDYSIALDSTDIQALLRFLSEQRSAFVPGSLQDMLGDSTHSLLRLLIASSTLPFEVTPSETQLKLRSLKDKLSHQGLKE